MLIMKHLKTYSFLSLIGFLFGKNPQAIQGENAPREKEGWLQVEAAGEEGRLGQNHLFSLSL